VINDNANMLVSCTVAVGRGSVGVWSIVDACWQWRSCRGQ